MSNSLKELNLNDYKNWIISDLILKQAKKFPKFNIIELGPGDGFKTFKLLEYLVHQKIEFHYVPIDISKEAIDILSDKLLERLPELSIQAKVGDYFEVLKDLKNNETPSFLLFLGSNIGNYLEDKANNLLALFHQSMKIYTIGYGR